MSFSYFRLTNVDYSNFNLGIDRASEGPPGGQGVESRNGTDCRSQRRWNFALARATVPPTTIEQVAGCLRSNKRVNLDHDNLAAIEREVKRRYDRSRF